VLKPKPNKLVSSFFSISDHTFVYTIKYLVLLKLYQCQWEYCKKNPAPILRYYSVKLTVTTV